MTKGRGGPRPRSPRARGGRDRWPSRAGNNGGAEAAPWRSPTSGALRVLVEAARGVVLGAHTPAHGGPRRRVRHLRLSSGPAAARSASSGAAAAAELRTGAPLRSACPPRPSLRPPRRSTHRLGSAPSSAPTSTSAPGPPAPQAGPARRSPLRLSPARPGLAHPGRAAAPAWPLHSPEHPRPGDPRARAARPRRPIRPQPGGAALRTLGLGSVRPARNRRGAGPRGTAR